MEQLIARGNKVVMKTYNRFPIAIECGNGMYVWDIEGKKYIDFVAGIAVNSLGYASEALEKNDSKTANEINKF